MEAIQPPKDMNRAIVAMLERGCAIAIATILKTEGSAPRKAGVKAIIDAGGRIQGTIGGGQVEAQAQRLAVESIKTGRSEVFEFRLQGGAVASGEPICGGLMRVLVDPKPARHRAAFEAAADALALQERGLLLTSIRESADCRVTVEFLAECAISSEMGFPGEAALRSALATEETVRFNQEATPGSPTFEVMVEPVIPLPRLLIAGGGHVGQAVAVLANLAGFEVVVLDDRPEFANASFFPEGVIARCGAFSKGIEDIPFGAGAYIVVVTQGHRQDAEALAACIRKPSAYIGMIGSRRKVAMMRQEFVESGLATEAEFDRVHAPIGLDIGAATVPEIAVSIVAQLISVRRRGNPRHKPSQS